MRSSVTAEIFSARPKIVWQDLVGSMFSRRRQAVFRAWHAALLILFICHFASSSRVTTTYLKPNLYFGTTTAEPNPVSTGFMWYRGNQVRHTRHEARKEDKLERWGWLEHDGRNYGKQKIYDKPFYVNTTYIKETDAETGDDTWRATIELGWNPRKKLPTGRKDVTGIFYVWDAAAENSNHSLEVIGDVAATNRTIIVDGKTYHLVINEEEASSSLETHFWGGSMPRSDLWKAKDWVLPTLMTDMKAQLDDIVSERQQKKPRKRMTKREYKEMQDSIFPALPDLIVGKKGNFVAIQKAFKMPFKMTVTFRPMPMDERIDTLSHAREGELKEAFDKNFESVFKLQSSADYGDAKHIQFAKYAFGNLIGSITYFYGSSLVQNPVDGRPPTLSEPGPLVTGVPSRSFFPRGFLWDEGFHQLLVVEWDPKITVKVLRHWFSRMDENGWIPREQILGDEALSKVPEQFRIQSPDVANPPALLLSIERLMTIVLQQKKEMEVHVDGTSSEEAEGVAMIVEQFLKETWPKLQRWYKWLKKTQKGPDTGTFRWRGRTSTHTLSSGLDDYPRGEFPSEKDRHVDLLSWMAYAAGVLGRLSTLVRDSERTTFFERDQQLFIASLEKHWHEEDGLFYDFGVRNVIHDAETGEPKMYSPPELIPHFGYVSVFPLALRLLKPSDPRLGRLLEALSDPKRLWSEYGLRSLSKKDRLFGRGEDYWRGKIWININFLVLKALHEYSHVEGPYQAEAAKLYSSLRTNVVSNIFSRYVKNGFIFENYDSITGVGKGCHPFTGWSSLVVLIMAERY